MTESQPTTLSKDTIRKALTAYRAMAWATGLWLIALCYELVAPAGEESPVTQVLKTRRNVINHLAYRVSNLQASAERLRTQRHLPLGPSQPAIAFGGSHVQFFLSPLGHIVELIEGVE